MSAKPLIFSPTALLCPPIPLLYLTYGQTSIVFVARAAWLGFGQAEETREELDSCAADFLSADSKTTQLLYEVAVAVHEVKATSKATSVNVREGPTGGFGSSLTGRVGMKSPGEAYKHLW